MKSKLLSTLQKNPICGQSVLATDLRAFQKHVICLHLLCLSRKKFGFISNKYFSRSGIKDLRAEPKHFNSPHFDRRKRRKRKKTRKTTLKVKPDSQSSPSFSGSFNKMRTVLSDTQRSYRPHENSKAFFFTQCAPNVRVSLSKCRPQVPGTSD